MVLNKDEFKTLFHSSFFFYTNTPVAIKTMIALSLERDDGSSRGRDIRSCSSSILNPLSDRKDKKMLGHVREWIFPSHTRTIRNDVSSECSNAVKGHCSSRNAFHSVIEGSFLWPGACTSMNYTLHSSPDENRLISSESNQIDSSRLKMSLNEILCSSIISSSAIHRIDDIS